MCCLQKEVGDSLYLLKLELSGFVKELDMVQWASKVIQGYLAWINEEDQEKSKAEELCFEYVEFEIQIRLSGSVQIQGRIQIYRDLEIGKIQRIQWKIDSKVATEVREARVMMSCREVMKIQVARSGQLR